MLKKDMGIVEFFKKFGQEVKKFTTKVFSEDQFVEYDSREDLKAAIVTSGMSKEEGSLLVKGLDDCVNRGNNFNDVQNRDIEITPADRDYSNDLEQDSVIKDIRKGINKTPIPDKNRYDREHGGKTRTR